MVNVSIDVSPKHVYYTVLIIASVMLGISVSLHLNVFDTEKAGTPKFFTLTAMTTLSSMFLITMITRYLRRNVYLVLLNENILLLGNVFKEWNATLLDIESIKVNSSRGTFYTITTKTGKSFEFISN